MEEQKVINFRRSTPRITGNNNPDNEIVDSTISMSDCTIEGYYEVTDNRSGKPVKRKIVYYKIKCPLCGQDYHNTSRQRHLRSKIHTRCQQLHDSLLLAKNIPVVKASAEQNENV